MFSRDIRSFFFVPRHSGGHRGLRSVIKPGTLHSFCRTTPYFAAFVRSLLGDCSAFVRWLLMPFWRIPEEVSVEIPSPKHGGLGLQRCAAAAAQCVFIASLLRGCCVVGARSLMAPAIRGARAGAIRGWVLELLNRSRSVVIFVMDILGLVEPSSPDRDAIPRRDPSSPRGSGDKAETCLHFVSALYPLFGAFIPKVETEWKQSGYKQPVRCRLSTTTPHIKEQICDDRRSARLSFDFARSGRAGGFHCFAGISRRLAANCPLRRPRTDDLAAVHIRISPESTRFYGLAITPGRAGASRRRRGS